MPDDDAKAASIQNKPRRKAHWRQSDVKRAIGAAEEAGLQNYRVEIAPDGTIAIVVVPPDLNPDGNDFAVAPPVP